MNREREYRIKKYIRRLRNQEKKLYAVAWADHVLHGAPEPERGKLSFMAAQAVRLEIGPRGMLTLRVHSVLAGAYLNGRSGTKGGPVLPKRMLTHAVATSPDFELVLCGRILAERLCDLDEGGDPSCPKCLRIFRSMLTKRQAERALHNGGDCSPVMTDSDINERTQ